MRLNETTILKLFDSHSAAKMNGEKSNLHYAAVRLVELILETSLKGRKSGGHTRTAQDLHDRSLEHRRENHTSALQGLSASKSATKTDKTDNMIGVIMSACCCTLLYPL